MIELTEEELLKMCEMKHVEYMVKDGEAKNRQLIKEYGLKVPSVTSIIIYDMGKGRRLCVEVMSLLLDKATVKLATMLGRILAYEEGENIDTILDTWNTIREEAKRLGFEPKVHKV